MPAPAVPPVTAADDLWIVLPHLGAGGAQKVAMLAADHFASQGLQVRVITLLPGHSVVAAIPSGVVHVDLGPAVIEQRRATEALLRGDCRNRALLARGHRFLIAQRRRTQRWIAKGMVRLLMHSHVLERMARPGHDEPASRLLHWCVRELAGPQLDLLERELAMHRPQRVLAMLSRTCILCCTALWNQPTHLVISERNDPSRHALPFPWPVLQTLLYRRADVVTANTAGVLDSLALMPRLRRLELLPNPLPARSHNAETASGAATPAELQPPGFICLGRLVHQKGLDVLMKALPQCSGAASLWPVQLVGDGPERRALEQQAELCGIAERIHFAGFQRNPAPFLAQASVFVLPSRFEGMPNALLEAMAAGLAVIVTDASPGPLEVVEHRRSGLVVPVEDAAALAAAMSELAEDPELRHRLGLAARQRITALSWPVIEPTWRSVLALP